MKISFKSKFLKVLQIIKVHLRRLIFPIYLFPIRLPIHIVYYSIVFLFKLAKKLIRIILTLLLWPFKSWKNFGKTIIGLLILTYLVFIEIRLSILVKDYGGYNKFFCLGYITKQRLKNSVVRIVGGLSEGSGFFVSEDQVLTNFHVIADEPSPKIIFPNGKFITPYKIKGNKDADLALLLLKEKYPERVLIFSSPNRLKPEEPLLSAGYPLGTELVGEATVIKGVFNSLRHSKQDPVDYLQTNMVLTEGMSGGPLVDQCGKVVGVNTMGISGMSLFISIDSIKKLWPSFTDQDIAKIKVNPSASPQEAVKAYYSYLKARRMEEGFKLLSQEYSGKTNFEEWTNRFKDILDVEIYLVQAVPGKKNLVFIKFTTKNWVDNEAEYHAYEGTWQTVFEDGVYKMLRSNIKEVENPDWSWCYGE